MKVLLTFLGLGSPRRDDSATRRSRLMEKLLERLGLQWRRQTPGPIVDHVYERTAYYLDPSAPSRETRYVQAAIVELATRDETPFDRIIVAMTPQSREWHWDKPGRLRDELGAAADTVETVQISDELGVEAQWSSFEKVLATVPLEAELYVDLTHGFRAIPILFSVAVEFLSRVKGVRLRAAYYGAYEPRKPGPFPIVEMSPFFAVNRWADAVRAVTEDANPSPLAGLAAEGGPLELHGLHGEALIRALTELAAVIKNADASKVAVVAAEVLVELERARASASPAARALLDLLVEKFGSLARAGGERLFSPDWYETQLELARVMVGHGLLMQGLTILQELTTSWCEEACAWEMANADNAARSAYVASRSWRHYKKKYTASRRGFGEMLRVRLTLTDDACWRPQTSFDPGGELVRGIVTPPFEQYFRAGKERGVYAFMSELGKLRNAFNHAWVGRQHRAPDDTAELARDVDGMLAETTARTHELLEVGAIGRKEPVLSPPRAQSA